jgi:hypothetical protein
MPRQKKPRLLDDRCASAGDLSTDVLANILGYLDSPKDIMQKRRVCKKWKEAVKMTVVALVEFHVNNMESYNAMAVMTEAMPNLQQIKIGDDCARLKYNDGEDPDEERAARTVDYTSHNIGILSNFSKLRILEIHLTDLNGRYPFLFNSFPLLEKLSIEYCRYLKWDLEMLAGLPSLKELNCIRNECLTGNINSLRVLKDTLEKVNLNGCKNVEGNFMDLSDFPHLKELDLCWTGVTGDIRDIGENAFSALERLGLSKGVYGGRSCEFQHIVDAPDLVRTVYLLKKQRPALEYYWFATLSRDSADWYESVDENYDYDAAPFYIRIVEAGSRIGYRWQTKGGGSSCEVNWLDPEPDRESSDYEKYIEESQKINSQVRLCRGFLQPPTEEEYNRLHNL